MKQLMQTKSFYWGIFVLSLLLGYWQKTPCFTGSWAAPDFVQYRWCCYNDLQALYSFRALDQRKIPYVEEKKFEYPPLIGYQMYLTSLVTTNHVEFFRVNVLLNAVWAAIAFGVLIACFGYGEHLLWFAAAPALLFYLGLNWDISSVMFLCLAFFAGKKGRFFWTGAALGIGFTGKMFPLFVLPPLCFALFQESKKGKKEIKKVVGGAIAGWVTMNAPIALLDWVKNQDYHALFTVFGFHSARTPDFGTLWYWIGEFLQLGPTTHAFTAWVDKIFLAGMVLFTGFALWKQLQRGSSPWGTAAAITAFCLVLSKIHSPQYGIWFLGYYLILHTPWKILLPYLLADICVFLNGFWWIAHSPTLQPHFYRTFFILAILARATALGVLAFYWVFHSEERRYHVR